MIILTCEHIMRNMIQHYSIMVIYRYLSATVASIRHRRDVPPGPALVSRIRHRSNRLVLIHPRTVAGNIPNTCSGIHRCWCPPALMSEKEKKKTRIIMIIILFLLYTRRAGFLSRIIRVTAASHGWLLTLSLCHVNRRYILL